MVEKAHRISLDELLIHPGDTLLEVIRDRNISQKELSIRTGSSEKHISTVINGKKAISTDFAKKLEYALDISASFWKNLQSDYELELVMFNEKHNITEKEMRIAKEIKPLIVELSNIKIDTKNETEAVYNFRGLLGVSNLESISNLNSAQYRAQYTKNASPYVMYTWQYLCEKEAQEQSTQELDIEKLKDSIESIKTVMHEDASTHISSIQKILNECGISFVVQKHVTKAPINGLTVKTKKGDVLIAMTIRGRYIDLFWFTLFHEIAHVINGDYLIDQSNYDDIRVIENRADQYATSVLIDEDQYSNFVSNGDYSINAINIFAKNNNVLPTIVVGRLMKDKYIPWSQNQYRTKYSWVNK